MSARFLFSPGYDLGRGLPLRSVHGFVLDRPTRTRAALIEHHGVDAGVFEAVDPCDVAQLTTVHTPALTAKLQTSAGIADAVEMPPLAYLPGLMTRHAVLKPQLAAAGGTSYAIAAAAEGAWVLNLSGGFHHARPDRAHGFCLVNDVALGVYGLRARGNHRRVVIIDLDAHQGDGNAAAFAAAANVFTLSVHEEGLFPHPKLRSSLDVGLPSALGDEGYADAVEAALRNLNEKFKPEIIVYIAGVDPWIGDPLSTLRVSADGLRRRDERVARFARERGAGLVVLPAGGYTRTSPLLSAAGMAAVAALAP